MLANPTRPSMLDWLQLSPELLSARSAPPVRLAPPLVADVTTADHAPISMAHVMSESDCMMVYVPVAQEVTACAPRQEASMLRTPGGLPQPVVIGFVAQPVSQAYDTLEQGGSQRAAMAEMAGYLATGLKP